MIYWIKVRELWVLYRCVLRQSSVSPRIHAPVLPDKLQKDYKTFSIWLQNKDKTKTQNALCNFSKSPHMFRSPGYMAWCVMRLVHFCPYINGLRSALVGVWLIRLFILSWLVWAFRAWERECVWRSCVFISVDVKYIIHYKRMCKFICSL